ncbi:MAG TPA: caspase family protein [Flavilitoribacter sp.]|nr:caspase family protein [Flavilitoribacter sp.]HMQ86620.1 caspase family protein [Flavilitoribacter sp.]
MNTLYALFASINNYPDPKLVLDGCVNDQQLIVDFLGGHCQKLGYQFVPLRLKDEAATRDGIIAGFKHFDQAGPDDGCLFYFSGHGSQSPTPDELAKRTPDGMSESLVCYDSRSPGGRDLMGVELSWLIWKAGKKSKQPFITILDCCHSGRMRKVIAGKTRHVPEPGASRSLDTLLGKADYLADPEGKLYPPLGRRIHLGACSPRELAKEITADGKPNGVFTYSLVEALSRSSPFLSYSELRAKVNVRVRGLFLDQSPQLETREASDKNLVFLYNRPAKDRHFIVGFRPGVGWSVDAGAAFGFQSGHDLHKTTFELINERRQVEVSEVLPNLSKITGAEDLDPKKTYPARIVRQVVSRLSFALAPGNAPTVEDQFRDYIQQFKSDVLAITDHQAGSDYLIHIKDSAFYLTNKFSDEPLFRKSPGWDLPGIRRFTDDLEKVASWRRVLGLSNPNSKIDPQDLEIEFFQGTDPGNDSDDMPVKQLDWVNPDPFEYKQKGGAWRQPTFQFKVTSRFMKPLYVSLLYLDSNFGITNHLMAKEMLESGQTAWAQEVLEDGQSFRSILLQVEDHFYEKGMDEIDDFLLLIASTEELDTDILNQEGLPPEPLKSPTRGPVRRTPGVIRDWTTRLIPLKIIKPLED